MSNQQNASPGQFAPQGTYGGVTGAGFGAGAGLAKDREGNPIQGGGKASTNLGNTAANNSAGVNIPQQELKQQSSYEGYGASDSSASGGFGLNAGGSSYSRANQMGAADVGSSGKADETWGNGDGQKTGASTPGYRKEGEDPSDSHFRGQNLAFSQKKDNDEPEI